MGDDRKPFKTREGSVPDLSTVLHEAVERARNVVEEKSANLSEEEKENVEVCLPFLLGHRLG